MRPHSGGGGGGRALWADTDNGRGSWFLFGGVRFGKIYERNRGAGVARVFLCLPML